MKNKIKAASLMIFFGVLTFLDCYLTWLNTPDLKNEANPLVTVLGRGWGTLITVNIITLVVYCVLTYFAFVKYKTPVVTAENEADLKEKLKNASGKGSFFAMFGFSMAISLILARLVVVMEWLTVHLGWNAGWMEVTRGIMGFPRPDIIVAVATTLIFAIIWLVLEEKKKKKLAIVVSGSEASKELGKAVTEKKKPEVAKTTVVPNEAVVKTPVETEKAVKEPEKAGKALEEKTKATINKEAVGEIKPQETVEEGLTETVKQNEPEKQSEQKPVEEHGVKVEPSKGAPKAKGSKAKMENKGKPARKKGDKPVAKKQSGKPKAGSSVQKEPLKKTGSNATKSQQILHNMKDGSGSKPKKKGKKK